MSDNAGMLVLQASGNLLRIAEVSTSNGRVQLANPGSFIANSHEADASALTDPTVLDALAQYVSSHDWNNRSLVCVLGGSSIACQYYDLPPLKADALRRAALLKLGQQLHYDVSQAVVSVEPFGVPDAVSQARVKVTAAPLKLAEAAVSAAERVGVKLEKVTGAPAALTTLAQEVLPLSASDLHAVLYLEEDSSTLSVFRGTVPSITTDLPIGMADFTKALKRPIIAGDGLIQLTDAEAAALRTDVGIPTPAQEIASLGVKGERILPLLESVLQQLAKQLVQWLTFASTHNRGPKVAKLWLVGPGASIKGLADTLAARLSMSAESLAWLQDIVVADQAAEVQSLDNYASVVAVSRCRLPLPDLTPPTLIRRRRIIRARHMITVGGFVAAAAIVLFALLLDRVGTIAAPASAKGREQLAGVQEILDLNNRLLKERQSVAGLGKLFNDFSFTTPAWAGVLKEISNLLPPEVQARTLQVRHTNDVLTLIIEGSVYSDNSQHGFDETVEQSLRLLQRSPFFEKVRLLSANGALSRDSSGALGTFSIEAGLVYPKTKG